MKFQQQPESTWNSCQSNKTCYSIPTKTRKKIEIFREHMIENLYLDLAEETNDQKFYGKLFQSLRQLRKSFSKRTG
jgi:hypothetical protein